MSNDCPLPDHDDELVVCDGTQEEFRRIAGLIARAAMADGSGVRIVSAEAAERILDRAVEGLCRSHSAASGDGLYRRVIRMVERSLIRSTLQRSGGCQLKAARILGINRNTLRGKMQQLGVRSIGG
ncbi:MAG TPA: helix-turn-helix domain-containing protein [Phycisphaerae bacterium]|nr:hypothetical protein [Phycisphaerae bacterium]HOI56849.1 helix-turn-helix domain-containing protein [Phycisphaerae bacterium]